MATFLSGAAFGASLLAADFHKPTVVVSQLLFQNWHMSQAFLTATAGSAVIYAIAERAGYVKLQPRSSSPLGFFSAYDGNILGGALLGAGMGLSGSCPGTLLAQLAAGVQTGFFALGGAIVGGILWSGFLAERIKKRKEVEGLRSDASTVGEKLGISRGAALLLLEAATAALVLGTTLYTPQSPGAKVSGFVGGLFIASAQLFSLLTRRTMMGVSGSYEEAGHIFWWLAGGADPKSRPRAYKNIVFAAGAAAGAWSLAQLAPSLVQGPIAEVSPLLAVAGGALMVVGSRVAGGCTSGHGISGISLLSASSVVTIAMTFAVGGVVASLVH